MIGSKRAYGTGASTANAGSSFDINRMLVSIGRAFGLNIDTFGTLDNATGGLPML